MPRPGFDIGSVTVQPGTRRSVDIPVSVMSDHTPVTLSAHVIHGKRPGPVFFVSASVHGDEVIGVEIVRRLLGHKSLNALRGTLIAVPIVNSFGFMNHSRYLPDRRDLNRSFPGSARGSLASRLAHIFVHEIVARSNYGIDLHSAAIHRTNMPQIRVSPKSARTMKLAQAFAPPLILVSSLREGSLRSVADAHGVDMLLYEAGEGLRFDEYAVRVGLLGILRVMRGLDMISSRGVAKPAAKPLISDHSSWVRAPMGGLLRAYKAEGDAVIEGDLLAVVSDPFGEKEREVRADTGGVVVGRTVMPIVNEGDGIFHIAVLRDDIDTDAALDTLIASFAEHPLFDEDEIV